MIQLICILIINLTFAVLAQKKWLKNLFFLINILLAFYVIFGWKAFL